MYDFDYYGGMNERPPEVERISPCESRHESPYESQYESQYESPYESPPESLPAVVSANNRKPPKRRRKGIRTALAGVCCIAMMLGSGLAGAKIIESRYNVPQGSAGISQSLPIDTEAQGGGDSNGGIGGAGSESSESSESPVEPLSIVNPTGDEMSLTDLFIGADPAVVAISTQMTGTNVFGRIVTQPAAGSGFIISQDGYIVTNNHVVEDATSIMVLLNDLRVFTAELVGRDPVCDIAVLKIDVTGLSYLTWGDSDNLLVGEQVAAIGNALGEFANSMTVGYVSALDREINIDNTPRNMLQTDAAVNSGNSGGPLLNMKGQVIGVVTAKSIGSNVEGLGFAIPSNKAEYIVSGLISKGLSEGFGYVRIQAVMGVIIEEVEEDGLHSVHVATVNSGSAAEKAGVRVGDIVLSANGVAVSTISELKNIINEMYPGDKLVLIVLRDGKELPLSVILEESIPASDADTPPGVEMFPNDGSYTPFDPDTMFPGFWEQRPREGGSR